MEGPTHGSGRLSRAMEICTQPGHTPFLGSPFQVPVVHSTSGVHDVVHAREKLLVVTADQRQTFILLLQEGRREGDGDGDGVSVTVTYVPSVFSNSVECGQNSWEHDCSLMA